MKYRELHAFVEAVVAWTLSPPSKKMKPAELDGYETARQSLSVHLDDYIFERKRKEASPDA